MGRDDGLPWEGPSHNVAVATFLLDNTEVTNAEYVGFVGTPITKLPVIGRWPRFLARNNGLL